MESQQKPDIKVPKKKEKVTHPNSSRIRSSSSERGDLESRTKLQ